VPAAGGAQAVRTRGREDGATAFWRNATLLPAGGPHAEARAASSATPQVRRPGQREARLGRGREAAFWRRARQRSPRSRPAASAAIGRSEVSVMPGATFTSRKWGVSEASTIKSVREMSRRPSAVWAVTAVSAQAAAAAGERRAGAKNSVWPAVYPAA